MDNNNKTNTKNKIITISFCLILVVTFLMNLLTKDNELSTSERRKLEQFPKLSLESITNSTFMNKLDTYSTDQFIFRNTFREIKAWFNNNIYFKKDNNNLFVKNNAIYKMEYPLNEYNLNKTLDKISNVYAKYLKNTNTKVYYSIIPDKNYYLENDDHLKMDYTKLINIAENTLKYMTYIDITDELELNSYYKTDLHWKQECLNDVVSKLQKGLNLPHVSTEYIEKDLGDYYGTYYSQLKTNVPADRIYALTNSTISNLEVYNYETNKFVDVYSNKQTMDKYDTYLHGATPLLRIDNKNIEEKKELIIFRDSFASSLAPLLTENYSTIYLVDLRYIDSKLLENYITFNDQDVLFIYSTTILNSNVLR